MSASWSWIDKACVVVTGFTLALSMGVIALGFLALLYRQPQAVLLVLAILAVFAMCVRGIVLILER